DLHWDITMMVRSRGRIEGLWRSAAPVDSGGVRYHYFKPEELLLYLSAHLVNSGAFRQLRHIRDIERLIERYGNEIDWNSVVGKAREWRLSGSLYAALVLIRQSSGFAEKWENVLRELKISLPKRLFIRFFADKKVVTGDGFRRRFLDAFLSYTFFEIVEAASLKDYLDIFKRVFFPPRETIGGSGYCLRIVKGAVKLAGRIIP
ncbi:MAG: nucleotidyltransferase family protein, partial [Candidatus Omnitrophica bacterium]|nr:nucleotidyltransferase family protein [Candidatus Omnitrophota bacterium]